PPRSPKKPNGRTFARPSARSCDPARKSRASALALRVLRLLDLAMLGHVRVLSSSIRCRGLLLRAASPLPLLPSPDNITTGLSLQLGNQKNSLNFSNLMCIQVALNGRSAA